ncbi:MAG: DUF3109 family protein [Candidatus Riflebacteria bacterium]|nr:DUF3109 family protein [Candidatus Riflebacteria bacterium]
MREIGNVIISEEVWQKRFACNLDKCLGRCCQYGDLGAPISEEEEQTIAANLDNVAPLLKKQNLQLLRGGISEKYKGNLHIVEIAENTPCPLSFTDEKGIILCSLHSYALEKRLPLLSVKPLWCSLFPLIIKKTATGWLINCHIPEFCHSTDDPQPLLLSFADLLETLFGNEWVEEVRRAYQQQAETEQGKSA